MALPTSHGTNMTKCSMKIYTLSSILMPWLVAYQMLEHMVCKVHHIVTWQCHMTMWPSVKFIWPFVNHTTRLKFICKTGLTSTPVFIILNINFISQELNNHKRWYQPWLLWCGWDPNSCGQASHTTQTFGFLLILYSNKWLRQFFLYAIIARILYQRRM